MPKPIRTTRGTGGPLSTSRLLSIPLYLSQRSLRTQPTCHPIGPRLTQRQIPLTTEACQAADA